MDTVAMMSEYADWITTVHLTDTRRDQAATARTAGADYHHATRGDFTVWTEPGRGDVDLLGAIAALPNTLALMPSPESSGNHQLGAGCSACDATVGWVDG